MKTLTQDTAIAELLDLAIEAEQAAERLYREMARKFAHLDEVAAFWRRYADAEAGHARRLRHIQGTVSPRQLSMPLDPRILQKARKLQRTMPKTLQAIENLEDAYQLAHELEHSEVNTVFEVLVANFASDEEAQTFLRSQLREHVAWLIDGFPEDFREPAARRAVRALE